MINNILIKHPAHLWIGDEHTLKNNLLNQLQKIFCKQQGCLRCTICKQITEQQHPYITWIIPQNSYTLEDLDIVFDQIQFKLDKNQHKFFIFTQSDTLTLACSNKLLKTIEEPHQGYHFIFFALRNDTILPTIISRCLIQTFDTTIQHQPYEELLNIFIHQNFKNPQTFLKILDNLQINSQNSKDIIDFLFHHFYKELKKSSSLHNNVNVDSVEQNMNKLLILKKEINQLPISGSSKIFLKNILLRFHILHS